MTISDCDDRLRPEPLWRRLMRRLAASAAAPPDGATDTPGDRLPVYRITRAPDDWWIVQRPESTLEHAFNDACSAEDFVRQECADSIVMVVLRIDSFYAAARIDRNASRLFPQPHKFGGALRRTTS